MQLGFVLLDFYFYVYCFVDRFSLLYVGSFSFGHCVVCPSSIYDSDCPFGIFTLFDLNGPYNFVDTFECGCYLTLNDTTVVH